MASRPVRQTPADKLRAESRRMRASADYIKQQNEQDWQAFALNLFAPAKPPPGVLPEGAKPMAMDEGLVPGFGAWASQANLSFTEGTIFLGYPYLAQISQRREYFRAAQILATDATRKWITFDGTGKKKAGDKVERVERRLQEMQTRAHVYQLVVDDAYFGRGHLYLDVGEAWNKPLELPTDIGNGRTETSELKVGKKTPLTRMKTVEAVWTYPTTYNAINPLREDWYDPTTWYVMGQEVHSSRLLTMISRPVPDLLKPAYSFGGFALSQQMKDDVDIWRRTRDSVADMLEGYSQFVLKTDMTSRMAAGGEEGLAARVDTFTAMRGARGLHVIDMTREDLTSVSQPLGTLDILQAQSQEHVATAAGIPLVRYIGDQPAGLNASSEGAIRMHYDGVSAFQEAHLRPILETIVDLIQLSEWGELDPDIQFKFVPLWEMDEKQVAELDKLHADTDHVRIDDGVIDQEEARIRLTEDPRSPYQGLDPTDLPELEQEEEEGLVVKGSKGAEGGGE